MTDTKPSENLKTIWKNLAKKIIACLLVDEGAIFPVMEIIQDNERWFPDKERLIWRAILECVEEMVIPTVESVAAKLGAAVPLTYLQTIAGLFNDNDNRQLIYHVEQLREVGVLVSIKRLGKELVSANSTDDIDHLTNRVTLELSGLLANRVERHPDTNSIDRTTWAEVEAFSGMSIPTGLQWFDDHAGGLWPGMNYWVVAAYKSGKSTIMRNCILTAARAGFPTAAYCAEGSREMFELDCLAMLAAGNVLSRESHLKDQLRFSGLWIKRAWNKRDRLMKRWEVEAIECARQIWRELPIRVYDSRDGIKDLTTLHYLIKRDKLKFGVQSAWLDYSQLFGKGETIYDRQSTTAQKIQDIASSEMVAIAALAQKNEEGVRAKGDSASPAVKGGGDAAAAADFLLIPEIDRDTGNYMELKLKFSRHVAPRDGQHVIDPPSGLVLDRWFKAGVAALN
jgi:hypothetical protein